MTRAVQEIILSPMREMYLPPLHLRQNHEAQGRAMAAYERALGRFSAATLARAWDKVVAEQTYWVWPNPGVIVEACRQCEPRNKPPSEEEQRQAIAHEMADQYVSRYMKTSQVAKLARREGWAGRLREYVHDVAWVQAQLICQVRHIGWDARLADGLGRFGSSAEAFAAYRPTIDKQVWSTVRSASGCRVRGSRGGKRNVAAEVREPLARSGRASPR